jgi:hypothetical protein
MTQALTQGGMAFPRYPGKARAFPGGGHSPGFPGGTASFGEFANSPGTLPIPGEFHAGEIMTGEVMPGK